MTSLLRRNLSCHMSRNRALILLTAVTLLAAQAHGQPAPANKAPADQPISEQEFQSGIVNKLLQVKGTDGKDYKLRFEDGGRAVVSLGYNDVGQWRSNGPGAYCVRWNKNPMDERCAYVTRREDKLFIVGQPNGTGALIERAE